MITCQVTSCFCDSGASKQTGKTRSAPRGPDKASKFKMYDELRCFPKDDIEQSVLAILGVFSVVIFIYFC